MPANFTDKKLFTAMTGHIPKIKRFRLPIPRGMKKRRLYAYGEVCDDTPGPPPETYLVKAMVRAHLGGNIVAEWPFDFGAYSVATNPIGDSVSFFGGSTNAVTPNGLYLTPQKFYDGAPSPIFLPPYETLLEAEELTWEFTSAMSSGTLAYLRIYLACYSQS